MVAKIVLGDVLEQQPRTRFERLVRACYLETFEFHRYLLQEGSVTRAVLVALHQAPPCRLEETLKMSVLHCIPLGSSDILEGVS